MMRNRHLGRLLAIGAAALLLVVVGGPYVYRHFIEGKAPPRLKLSSQGPGAGSAGGTVPLNGTWNANVGSTAGYRVNEVLFGQKNEAYRRTDKVTGSIHRELLPGLPSLPEAVTPLLLHTLARRRSAVTARSVTVRMSARRLCPDTDLRGTNTCEGLSSGLTVSMARRPTSAESRGCPAGPAYRGVGQRVSIRRPSWMGPANSPSSLTSPP